MRDHAFEVNWFDQQLAEMLTILETQEILKNTIVVVTADNGMPFPYAKANLQEYGIHVPLAICGPNVPGGRKIEDLVSLIDLAPTFLEMTGRASWKVYGEEASPRSSAVIRLAQRTVRDALCLLEMCLTLIRASDECALFPASASGASIVRCRHNNEPRSIIIAVNWS